MAKPPQRTENFWKIRMWYFIAYLDFPYEYHMRLHTNNVQKRANEEAKWYVKAVQAFFSEQSLLKFIWCGLYRHKWRMDTKVFRGCSGWKQVGKCEQQHTQDHLSRSRREDIATPLPIHQACGIRECAKMQRDSKGDLTPTFETQL